MKKSKSVSPITHQQEVEMMKKVFRKNSADIILYHFLDIAFDKAIHKHFKKQGSRKLYRVGGNLN